MSMMTNAPVHRLCLFFWSSLALLPTTHGFTTLHAAPPMRTRKNAQLSNHDSPRTSSKLFLNSFLSERFHQLEELEDSETASTALFLRDDRTIAFGDTDGPRPVASRGRWRLQHRDFAMIIERTFPAGHTGTDMGAFEYTTLRCFRGQVTLVGDRLGISGIVYDAKGGSVTQVALQPPEEAVGYFHMIDCTDDRAVVLNGGGGGVATSSRRPMSTAVSMAP